MDNRKIQEAMQFIKVEENRLAYERDRIQDKIYEFESLKDKCQEAYECFVQAREALSEIV